MHCNHRNSKHPGACRHCWRVSIMMWSILYVGMFLMMLFHEGPTRDLGFGPIVNTLVPISFMVFIGGLIGHSIFTHWNRKD